MSAVDYTQLMQALGRQRPGSLPRTERPVNPEQAKDLAFRTEMQMALRLFGQENGEDSESGLSLSGFSPLNQALPRGYAGGTSLGSDALMMDALSTIARLTQRPGAEAVETAMPAGNVVRARVAEQPRSAVVDGALSAMFESGRKGVDAVGYDRVGGTSYGKFQIASRTGTMERFLNFLDERAPDWAERLRSAGPADTGGRRGAMPREWKAIASERPERFELLQRQFIRQDHYQPAREKILARTGVDVDDLPLAAREVLWSTAVQHGSTGAAQIFDRVLGSLEAAPDAGDFARKLIDEVYDYRKTQFGSSSSRVRASVQDRMDREKELALAMLDTGSLSRLV